MKTTFQDFSTKFFYDLYKLLRLSIMYDSEKFSILVASGDIEPANIIPQKFVKNIKVKIVASTTTELICSPTPSTIF